LVLSRIHSTRGVTDDDVYSSVTQTSQTYNTQRAVHGATDDVHVPNIPTFLTYIV